MSIELRKLLERYLSVHPAKPKRVRSLKEFGGTGDCLSGLGGSMIEGSTVLSRGVHDPPFRRGLVGKTACVVGATTLQQMNGPLPAGKILKAHIVSVAQDGKSVLLDKPATATVHNTPYACGTDNSIAMRAAFAAMRAASRSGTAFTLRIGGRGPSRYLVADAPGYYVDKWGGAGVRYIDNIDFSNCAIEQGPRTDIVIGGPIGFLAVNQAVYGKWTGLDPQAPALTSLTQSVKEGDTVLHVASTAEYQAGDWILALSGYVDQSGGNGVWIGYRLPDAQIVQIASVNNAAGTITIREPMLKPLQPENYPASWLPGGIPDPPAPPPGSRAPFGILNVTPILIHNFTYRNLRISNFWYTAILSGFQCDGVFIDGGNITSGASWYAANYVHSGKTRNVQARIQNANSPRGPFEYFWGIAVGHSYNDCERCLFTATGSAFLHCHEGAANCTIRDTVLRVDHAYSSPMSEPVSIRGRSYGLRIEKLITNGFDQMPVIYVSSQCNHGGKVDVTIQGRQTSQARYDIECHGTGGWQFTAPNTKRSRVYLAERDGPIPDR